MQMRTVRTAADDGVTTFVTAVRAALAQPLPGVPAQLRMAPTPRLGWDPLNLPPGTRDGAALVLVFPDNGSLHLALTVRASALRSHTGQVSLPGGGVDNGETVEAAALREAEEEIGVPRESVQLLGRLTPLHIPVSGYLLYPVVGFVPGRPAFRRSESEVARILEPSLADLNDPGRIGREERTVPAGGETVRIDVPFFQVDGEKVWGATAMVLAEFLAIL
jgi:8-oxo-dGTP pyrophosphatase MutT (NUDIX family)